MKLEVDGRARHGDEQQQKKKKMQELLERFRQFQDDQEENAAICDDVLSERMHELALLEKQGKLTLDSLTRDEQKRFLGEVADGRVGKWIDVWSPWWFMSEQKYQSETLARRRQLILEELDDEEEVREEEPMVVLGSAVLYPSGLFTLREAQNMPDDIRALLQGGRPPSLCLRYHLIEVLFAYALVLRAYNGEYGQDVAEAARLLLDLCHVLSVDARYGSVEHVCVACLEKQSSEGPAANTLALYDTQHMLQSRVFILDALSDTHTMLERYVNEFERHCESNKQVMKERKAARKKLAAVLKKLQFYKMWAHLTPIKEFQALAAEIAAYVQDKALLGAQG